MEAVGLIKKRGKAVMFVFFCLFAAISIRVAFLALKADTTRAATAQGSYTLTVDCPRGTIYGRNLEHITNHKEIYKAALTPTPEVMAAIYESFDKQTAEDIAEQLRSGKPVVTVVPAGFAAKGAKVFKCYDAVPDQQPAGSAGRISRCSFGKGRVRSPECL